MRNRSHLDGNDVTEMRTIMQQSKEKILEQQERIKDLEKQNAEMQEKIGKRDGMIMRLGGGRSTLKCYIPVWFGFVTSQFDWLGSRTGVQARPKLILNKTSFAPSSSHKFWSDVYNEHS